MGWLTPTALYSSHQHHPSCWGCGYAPGSGTDHNSEKTWGSLGKHPRLREVRAPSESGNRHHLFQFLSIWTPAQGLAGLIVPIHSAGTTWLSSTLRGTSLLLSRRHPYPSAQGLPQTSCGTPCPQVSSLFCVTFSLQSL